VSAAPRPAKINPGDEVAPGTAQSGEDVCPSCGGSGHQGEAKCPACAGTGIIIAVIGDA
jgi:DnaJ-class molecular chaperone